MKESVNLIKTPEGFVDFLIEKELINSDYRKTALTKVKLYIRGSKITLDELYELELSEGRCVLFFEKSSTLLTLTSIEQISLIDLFKSEFSVEGLEFLIKHANSIKTKIMSASTENDNFWSEFKTGDLSFFERLLSWSDNRDDNSTDRSLRSSKEFDQDLFVIDDGETKVPSIKYPQAISSIVASGLSAAFASVNIATLFGASSSGALGFLITLCQCIPVAGQIALSAAFGVLAVVGLTYGIIELTKKSSNTKFSLNLPHNREEHELISEMRV